LQNGARQLRKLEWQYSYLTPAKSLATSSAAATGTEGMAEAHAIQLIESLRITLAPLDR
jgi:hypothetical protein